VLDDALAPFPHRRSARTRVRREERAAAEAEVVVVLALQRDWVGILLREKSEHDRDVEHHRLVGLFRETGEGENVVTSTNGATPLIIFRGSRLPAGEVPICDMAPETIGLFTREGAVALRLLYRHDPDRDVVDDRSAVTRHTEVAALPFCVFPPQLVNDDGERMVHLMDGTIFNVDFQDISGRPKVRTSCAIITIFLPKKSTPPARFMIYFALNHLIQWILFHRRRRVFWEGVGVDHGGV